MKMTQYEIEELSNLVDKVQPCVIISSHYGLGVFRQWEDKFKDKYEVFEKVEAPDGLLANDNNIYLVSIQKENKHITIYFKESEE